MKTPAEAETDVAHITTATNSQRIELGIRMVFILSSHLYKREMGRDVAMVADG
jgi:hypothetical protein